MTRLDELADQLSSGEIALSEIDIQKELTILGLRHVAEEQKFAKQFLQTSPDIQTIVQILTDKPEFITPVENFIKALFKQGESSGA